MIIVNSYQWSQSLFYKHGLTLILARTSNYIYYKEWDEIIYPLPNFMVQLLKYGDG